MADLAAAIFDGLELIAGEGLALVSSNSSSTAAATLAVAYSAVLIESMEVAGRFPVALYEEGPLSRSGVNRSVRLLG